MPDVVEQLPSAETKNGTAFAVEWLIDHENEFADDLGLADSIVALKEIRQILDKDLEINPDRQIEILRASLQNFLEINSISVTAREALLISLANTIEAIRGEKDARADWWDSFRRQSLEDEDKISSTLLQQAGAWKTSFELANPLPDSGARELQKGVSQFLVDIASVVSKTATEPFKYVPELDGTGQQDLQQNASDYVEVAGRRSVKSGDLQVFNPLIYVENGRFYYRELTDFASANIRLMREKNGQCQYLDLPASVFLNQDTDTLNSDLQAIESDDNFNWEDIDTLVEDIKNSPIISISIADNPTPESKLYLLARSGKSIAHLNYNPARQKMEIYFNHLSFDGVSGTDFALGMAESIGTPKSDVLSGVSVDWQPPTQSTETSEEILNKIIARTENSLFVKGFEDEELAIEFVQSLGLSDVSISNDLDLGIYKNFLDLAGKINNTWHSDISSKIDQVIRADKSNGKTIPDEQTLKEIKNRLLSTKMTPTKFLDIMTREYYGPTVFCNTTRDPNARLTVCQPPIIEAIKLNLGQKLFGFSEKDRQEKELEELERACHRLTAEYTRSYLMDFSPIVGIQSQTEWFRKLTEITSVALSKEAYNAAMLIAMTSTLAPLVKGEARLSDFTSALTTSSETSFAYAISNIPLTMSDGENTLRYTHRVRHNPHTINKLDIINLSEGDLALFIEPEDIETVKQASQEILKTASDVYEDFDPNNPNVNNILLLAKTLKRNPQLKKSLGKIIIAATLKEQKNFYKYAGERAEYYNGLIGQI